MYSPDERKRKIESYGQAHDVLVEGLKAFPREMWSFKPAQGWSIQEILVHITDSEANSYVRCRRFIAEPGSGVYGYDTDVWSDKLGYPAQSADDAIDLFRALRRSSYHLIKDLPEGVWANTVEHSESGTMNFEKWLDIYERHIVDHLMQMKDVYEEWQKSKAN